jgi:Tfp pilus assembly pilus retraction ATPase PilT
LSVPGIGRFRCNAFHQCGELGFVFRAIKTEIPSFKDLNLRRAAEASGVAEARSRARHGVAGSGKSTTLAAMIEYVNRNMNKHIITIEDPIEFRFEDKRSIVNQREVGPDVKNFALRCVRPCASRPT